MTPNRRLAVASALTALAVSPGMGVSIAYGQEEGAREGALEQIIVTARRREEDLQVTPVSVTAFQMDALDTRTVRNIADLANYTPNLVTTSGPTGHNDGFYFIRGIGNVDLNPATDPGVGTYIDGVYLGRVMGANVDAMNLERVEVLRGPQGTLFGRNTIGGAINIVTHLPTGEFGGDVRVTGGEDGRFNAQGNLDFPVTDDLAGTVSAFTQNKDGRGKNVATGDTFGDTENYGARTKFVWSLSEALEAEFSADYLSAQGTSSHAVLVAVNPFAVSPLGVTIPADLGADVSSNIDDNFHSIDPDHDLKSWGLNLTVSWDLGAVAVKSITGYRDLDQFVTNDFDASQYTFYDNSFDTESDQFSEEIQLSGVSFDDRMNWLLGFYYYDESAFHNNAIALGGNNGVPVPPPTGPGYATRGIVRKIINNQRFNLDIEALAVFAHVTWNFTDSLRGTVGLRWTDEEKDQRYDFYIDNSDDVGNFAGLPPVAFIPTLSPSNPFLTIPTSYTESWDEVTPKLGLDYQWNDDVLLYATYSEGFRSGGFNGRPTPNELGQFGAVQPYDPETANTYEAGIKSEWLENTLRLNASMFFTKYQDIQLLVLGPSGFFETANAAEAELKGFEVELLSRPIEPAELVLAVGYLDTEYTKLDPGTIASGITGTDVLPNSPEWTVNVGGSWEWELAGGATIDARLDYSWKDEVYFNATNLPGEYQDAYGLWNARVAWSAVDDKLELAVYGLNLADEEYYTNGQDITAVLGVAFENVGPAREFGVEGTYRF